MFGLGGVVEELERMGTALAALTARLDVLEHGRHGPTSLANLQPLCGYHHDRKTRRARRRQPQAHGPPSPGG